MANMQVMYEVPAMLFFSHTNSSNTSEGESLVFGIFGISKSKKIPEQYQQINQANNLNSNQMTVWNMYIITTVPWIEHTVTAYKHHRFRLPEMCFSSPHDFWEAYNPLLHVYVNHVIICLRWCWCRVLRWHVGDRGNRRSNNSTARSSLQNAFNASSKIEFGDISSKNNATKMDNWSRLWYKCR